MHNKPGSACEITLAWKGVIGALMQQMVRWCTYKVLRQVIHMFCKHNCSSRSEQPRLCLSSTTATTPSSFIGCFVWEQVVMLYVDQETSIKRQLERARVASLHNKRVMDAGTGELWCVGLVEIPHPFVLIAMCVLCWQCDGLLVWWCLYKSGTAPGACVSAVMQGGSCWHWGCSIGFAGVHVITREMHWHLNVAWP